MTSMPGLFERIESPPVRPPPTLGKAEAVRLVNKYKKLVLCCFVFISILVLLGVARLSPSYSSSALVLVKLEEVGTPSFFSGIAAYRDPQSQDSANRRMENEMEIAESWPIVADAVKEANLTYSEVYLPPLKRLLQPFGDFFDSYLAPVFGLPPDPEKQGFGDTVTALRDALEVKPVVSKSSDTNSNIISLRLRGTEPKRTQQVLQAIVTSFLEHDVHDNLKGASQARDIIGKRLATAATELSEAQERLESDSRSKFLGRHEPSLLALERAVRLKESEVAELQKKAAEVETYVEMASSPSSSRVVVEEPLAARGSDWKIRALIAVIGICAGLFLAVALAGVLELLDSRLQSEVQARGALGLPVLASLPQLDLKEIRKLRAWPKHRRVQSNE
jgi:uncharacterized protein involved in exopolysaccharide biosynthesis